MRNAIQILSVLLLLATSACGGQQNAADAESRACLEKNGDWRRVCIAQKYQCVKAFADAGKSCNDSSECEGECLVDLATKCNDANECTDAEVPKSGEQVTGICQRDDDPCGSFVVVREGRAQPIVHRD